MPMHVWDTVTTPLSPGWSPPVASGNVWVRDGASWAPVRGLWVSDGAGGWSQFYAGFGAFPPTIAPTGSLAVVGGGGTGTVTLNLTNRQPQWRLRGTQRLFDFGVLVQSQTLDDASDGPYVQDQLGVSTTGEARWDVYYHDPVSGTDGPTAVLNIFF